MPDCLRERICKLELFPVDLRHHVTSDKPKVEICFCVCKNQSSIRIPREWEEMYPIRFRKNHYLFRSQPANCIEAGFLLRLAYKCGIQPPDSPVHVSRTYLLVAAMRPTAGKLTSQRYYPFLKALIQMGRVFDPGHTCRRATLRCAQDFAEASYIFQAGSWTCPDSTI